MPMIAITNLKGGTGKTTSSILLAEALYRLGQKVIVFDADPQASASIWAADAQEGAGPLHFDVVPANVQSIKAGVADRDTVVIVDCPPGMPTVIEAAINAADVILIPVSPSGIEVSRMWDTIEVAQAKGKDFGVLLTSVMLNTKTLNEILDALNDEDIPVYKTRIPQRQDIKRLWGTDCAGNLHGYQYLAEEIIVIPSAA
jgi:virC1 protein